MFRTGAKLIAILMLAGGGVAVAAGPAAADGGGGWVPPQPQVQPQPQPLQRYPLHFDPCGWNKNAGPSGQRTVWDPKTGKWVTPC